IPVDRGARGDLLLPRRLSTAVSPPPAGRIGGVPGGDETKDELRRRLAARLEAASAEQRQRAGAAARARLLDHPTIRRARSILVCLSFGTELDTAPLVERWTDEGRRLYVPRADPRDRMLHVHPWPSPLVQLS